jgi:hypothetical protein
VRCAAEGGHARAEGRFTTAPSKVRPNFCLQFIFYREGYQFLHVGRTVGTKSIAALQGKPPRDPAAPHVPQSPNGTHLQCLRVTAHSSVL